MTNRTRLVDFTQPYIESGLIIVAPAKEVESNAWAFLKPFTFQMWCVLGVIFLFVGAVVWVLEHRTNTEFRGPPRQQIMTVCWLVSAFCSYFFPLWFLTYFLIMEFLPFSGLVSLPCSLHTVSVEPKLVKIFQGF